MTIRINGALRLSLAGSALGGLIAFAPPATAQWLPPPWRAASPGEIERSLEARGYGLVAPLARRPGVYLADVTAGPGGYQRLVIDARSGQILERFLAPGRTWGPVLAARDEGFTEAPPGVGGPPPSEEFPRAPGGAPAAKSAYGGPPNVHIPAAISPYGAGEAPAGAKLKPKSVSTGSRTPTTKAPTENPPLPPPAPREARTTEVDNVPPAVAPAPPSTAAEASDKPKISIVPPALFE